MSGEPHERRRWQELAAQASIETDSRRLMDLISELCEEFERSGRTPAYGTSTEDRV